MTRVFEAARILLHYGLLALGLLVAPLCADAQRAGKVFRIGVLSPNPPPSGPSPFRDAFWQRLRELGWEEGLNLATEYRWAEGQLDRLPAFAADYPAPQEGSWVVRNFRFHTGEVLPELRLHYTTVGVPTGEPVLILHGTTGSGTNMLTPAFAGELFGREQPLDANRYDL